MQLNTVKGFAFWPKPDKSLSHDAVFSSDEGLTRYAATAVNSGTAVVPDTLRGGGLLMSGAATTDDSGANVQLDSAGILGAAGKGFAQVLAFTLSDATQSDALFGIGTIDTSLIAGVTEFIGFRKDDGDALLDCVVILAGAATEVKPGAHTVVADTEVDLALLVFWETATTGRIVFYVNGTEVANYSGTLPSGLMTESFAFQSGDNLGTKTCRIRGNAFYQEA